MKIIFKNKDFHTSADVRQISGCERPIARGEPRKWTTPLLALVSLGILACTSEQSPRERFDSTVLPLIQGRCAASVCHGVEPKDDASVDWDLLFFRLNDEGDIADPEAAYVAAKRSINTVENADFSSLIRKPLAVGMGGLPHYGRANFTSRQDPAYGAIYKWIESESGGGEDPEPLSELEQLFADTVQPVLVEGTCMNSACHGPTAGGIQYQLDIGLRGEFSIEAIRHNYLQTQHVVALDGYPMQSRLLRKSLPLFTDGIVHKGDNQDFYQGNPGGGVPAIVDWVCAERLSRTGVGCKGPDEAPIDGFVFIRGPVEARHAFDLDVFVPGRDVFYAAVTDTSLAPANEENLTAELHPEGPADVRDPAVSPDGRELLFTMRTRLDEGHHIYRMNLETRAWSQLTSGNGPLPGGGFATDRDPTWGPNGSVWFVSTRAGVLADQGQLMDADIYSLESLEPGVSEPRRWTHTPHIERKPVFLKIGEEAGGEVAFSSLREAIPAHRRAHSFRFPPSLETEYHQHFGVTPVADFFFDTREMPDGRYVATVGELSGVWRAGRLGIIDRNLGPEINENSESDTAALERYDAPLVYLDPDASVSGVTPGAYRDAAPLPDGRILVAYHSTPIDLSAANASFETRIEVLTLEENPDGTGPHISARTTLVETPGVANTDPEPVARLAPLRIDAPPLRISSDASGLLQHQGVPMVDALLANLYPSGEKVPREDIRSVRLIELLPTTPEQRSPVPADETRHDVSGATSTSLGPHGPARILAEIPLAEDGSFQARIPADVPFRMQSLNADGMAVGEMHNRWFEVASGQTLKQGISTVRSAGRYGARCSSCHGDPDGRENVRTEHEVPDMMTTASLTLSRYEYQNPRRPIAPPELGDSTRIEVDFKRDIQPILARSCAASACHDSSEPAAGLSLTDAKTTWFTDAYESLLVPGDGSQEGQRYVDQSKGTARGSFLIEKLLGQELGAPRELATTGEPHPSANDDAPPLTPEELTTLIRWIELGATFQGYAGDAP